jgi:hypothetical protein
MSRPRCRATLEAGLKLNINRLVGSGLFPTLGHKAFLLQRWNDNYTGEQTASATLLVERITEGWASCEIRRQDIVQRVSLEALPRHFGGVQWYFICPVMKRRAAVLWMPPGARTFACRQRWRGSVAYASQFCDRDNRAHRGQAKIKAKLCRIGGFDPQQWEFPPKPKGMRWRSYQRLEERFDRYEAILDDGIEELAARLFRAKINSRLISMADSKLANRFRFLAARSRFVTRRFRIAISARNLPPIRVRSLLVSHR